jgi:hypothetical protein
MELNEYASARASAREASRFVRDVRRGRSGIDNWAEPHADAAPDQRGAVVPFPLVRTQARAFAGGFATGFSVPFMAQVIGQELVPDRLIDDDHAGRGIAAYEATAARTDRFLVATTPFEFRT